MTPLRVEGSGYVPSEGDTPFHRLGGADGVRALAEAFYDAMEAHEPALTAVHKQDAPGKIALVTRERFGLFLVGWLGGPQDYVAQHGHPRLRARHGHVRVDVSQRDAWLRSMGKAMDLRGVKGPEREWLDKRFAEVADFLRNAEE